MRTQKNKANVLWACYEKENQYWFYIPIDRVYSTRILSINCNFRNVSKKNVQRFIFDFVKHFCNLISFIYSECQSPYTITPASTSGVNKE